MGDNNISGNNPETGEKGHGVDWNLGKITEAFAAAAVDSSHWKATMEVAAAATNSVGAILLPIRGRLPNVPFSDSVGDLAEAYFRDGWSQREERARGLGTMIRRGAFTDFDFMSFDEIAHNVYYQEFLGAFGFRWFGGVKVAFGDDLWVLAIQRSIAQQPFSSDETHQLAELSQSLSSAAALAHALGFARADAAMTAFEATGTAAVLMDRLGQVVRANQAAERLLGPDIKIVRRRIVSYDHAATAALDGALHQFLWRWAAAASMPPLTLPRRSKRPVLAHLIRLAGITGEPLADCQAVLVLVDLDLAARPPDAVLRACFGLTAAEARLAAILGSGTALEDAADQIGVSKETTRSQLKSVFAKTQTQRQAELVALLHRIRPHPGEPEH